MDRRTFVGTAGLGALGLATGCLDPERVGPAQTLATPLLLPAPRSLGGGVTVAISQWPDSADAAAFISADDLCPVNLGGNYDFGGSWGDPVATGSVGEEVESFVLGLLETYPRIRFSFNTITAMRLDPRTNGALDHAYPLSVATDWTAHLREIQGGHPGFVLGWHGYWHYDPVHQGPGEFFGYGTSQTNAALNMMEEEGRKSGLSFTRAFRPPGWRTTPALLEDLATRRYLLADCSSMSTFAGVRPSYVRTAAGNWLFRMGVTFDLTAAETFAQGGLFEAHHHMTPPNVNTLTDPANRDRITRFVEQWDPSTEPLIAWLSPDEVFRAYSDAAAVQWVASLSGAKVTIDLLNPVAIKPGITWIINSNDVGDAEILAGGDKLVSTVTQRPGVLKVCLAR